MAQSITVSISSRWHSVAICAAGVLGLVFLFFVNPVTAGWIPPCPFHALTGLDCPGCGSLRALHSLLHLRGMQALAYNPLTCLCLPFLGGWWLWHARRAITGQAPPIPFVRPILLWTLTAMLLFFGITRNLLPSLPVHPPAHAVSVLTWNKASLLSAGVSGRTPALFHPAPAIKNVMSQLLGGVAPHGVRRS